MCSGLMVVGHRLDCYSLLSVVFAVFHGHSGHGSLAQDIFSLAHPPDALTPNSASLWSLLVRVSLSVVSSQSLSRTAINVSLLRYIAFVFRLLVCLVPSHRGGHGHVYQKALRGNSRRYICTNICILTHLPTPTINIPTLSTPAHSPSHRLDRQSLSTRLRIAHSHAVCEQLLRSQLHWTTPHSWRPKNPPWLAGLGVIGADVTVNTSPSSPPSFYPSPCDDGVISILLPSPLLSKPPAPPCIKYLH